MVVVERWVNRDAVAGAVDGDGEISGGDLIVIIIASLGRRDGADLIAALRVINAQQTARVN